MFFFAKAPFPPANCKERGRPGETLLRLEDGTITLVQPREMYGMTTGKSKGGYRAQSGIMGMPRKKPQEIGP